jgi:hypothetical protein
MQIVDARDGRVMRAAREHAVVESGWLLGYLGLSALALWLAVHGLAEVAPGALWFIAGALAMETLNAAWTTASGRRELRRLRQEGGRRQVMR